MDHEIHVPLQDGVNRLAICLLHIHLALVAVGLRAELRIAGVPQVSIRDVGYANYDFKPFIIACLGCSKSFIA